MPSLSEACLRHSIHYVHVLDDAHELFLTGGENQQLSLTIFDSEWHNIQSGYRWAASQASKSLHAKILCCIYPDSGSNLLSLRQHPRERIKWLNPALDAAKGLRIRIAEIVHLNNLGNAFLSLNEVHNSIECYQQCLAKARESGDYEQESSALGNLGVANLSLGLTERAINYFQQRLTITCKLSDRVGESQTLNNLGTAYDTLGQTYQAINCFEQALSITREIGGRRDEGYVLGSLAVAHRHLGMFQRAVDFHKEQLII